MIKVLVAFGTRPEAIKMCPLIIEMKKHDDIQCKICLTGQHKEMLNQVMNGFGIVADYNLNIMREKQTLAMITSTVLNGVDKIIKSEQPDMVLVHGDTTTSMAVAMAAFYNQVKIGHVEAGLRTYDLNSPYPEEFNRQTVDSISNLYFAPTQRAKENLLNERKNVADIYVTGNTVIDAFSRTINPEYSDKNIEWCRDSKLILLTAHRRENIGEPLRNICRAINHIVKMYNDVKVIYPIHKNPKVREIALKELEDSERIRIIEPLDVFKFHNYINHAYMIMTDSGGIQEEAPSLGKPVLVMRDTTERPEGVEAGTLKLVGTNEDDIYKCACELLTDKDAYEKMSATVNPYGDGHAAEKIIYAIKEYYAKDINSTTNL